MKGEHLSDLELDKLRHMASPDADPKDLQHLSSCSYCHSRMDELENASRNSAQQLNALLSATEENLTREKRMAAFGLVPVLSAVALITVLVGVLFFSGGLGTSKKLKTDRVRLMGGPQMNLYLEDGTMLSSSLHVGRKLTARLSGSPPARAMIFVDVDGSFNVLWVDHNGNVDVKGSKGAGVEMDIEASGPPGKVSLLAIFGPKPLTEKKALEFARIVFSNSNDVLPEGWYSIGRTIVVSRGKQVKN